MNVDILNNTLRILAFFELTEILQYSEAGLGTTTSLEFVK